MFTSRPRSINGLFLLVAVVGLVFGSAGPAAASHYLLQGGSQESNGEEWGPSVDELCSDSNNQFTGAQFESTYYLVTEDAFTFVIYENGVAKVHYSGPLSMNIQHGDAVFGPQGAAPGECTGLVLVPEPVPLTKATVADASPNDGAVLCETRQEDLTSAAGTYSRVESDVLFDFKVSCSVKGNSSGLTAKRSAVFTNFTMAATQNTSGYLKILTTNIAVSGNGHL